MAERARFEIGFEGGGLVGGTAEKSVLEELERLVRKGDGGVVGLETEEGTLVVAVAKVAYLKLAGGGARVGFGAD
jgi:hypothetical protein